jgi:dienelactone hydrolase
MNPHIELAPNPALVDQPVGLRLKGFAPGQIVILQAQLEDDANQVWTSHATFQSDVYGVVDVPTQQPLAGSYTDVDGMGLFWSMTRADNGQAETPFVKRTPLSATMRFTASVDAQIVATATLERLFVKPEVTITPVREQGLVATHFQPAGAGPFPGVIAVGGSGGGLSWSEQFAALLAGHGYATLALAYFALEHLPAALVNIPLEYFEIAIHWLQAQSYVQRDKLAVAGGSRGGELALLLGARFPQIKAVVGYSPSGLLWRGVSKDEQERNKPAWTYGGQPLPCMPPDSPDMRARFIEQPVVVLTPLFLHGMANAVAVEQASIPVEQTQGPILLISGQDDQMWPAARLSEMVMQRLARHAHPHPYQHLSYVAAGHSIGLPHLPTTVTQLRHPINGLTYATGGNAKALAFARVDAWAQVLAFLAEHVGKPLRMDSH